MWSDYSVNSRVVAIVLISLRKAGGLIAILDSDRPGVFDGGRCPVRRRSAVSADSALITGEAASRAVLDERASTAIESAVINRVTVAAKDRS